MVDGDGDGIARRDMGAFEYQPPPPPAPASPGPGGSGSTSPADATPPGGGQQAGSPSTELTALTLSPNRFRPATKGPSVTAAAKKRRAKPGTVVGFTLTQPGRVTFTIERRTIGRRSGDKCVKATRKNRKAKRCALYSLVKKGFFDRDGAAGANRFRFTGRIGRKTLPAGTYLFGANVIGSSRQRFFKVVR
jgi:hypothetical protein